MLQDSVETVWKKKLSKRKYAVLREGEIEKPNTGRYVHTKESGYYYCEACGEPVLSSFSKVAEETGYASFKIAPEDVSVRVARTYSIEDGEIVRVFCTSCDSILGFVSSDDVQSVEDLEQGKRQRIAHIHSEAVRLKKNITFSNGTPLQVVLLIIFLLGSSFLWYWASSVTRHGDLQVGEVRVWIEDAEVIVRPIDSVLSVGENGKVDYFRESSVVLISLRGESEYEVLRSGESVDILWLNSGYSIIAYEKGVASNQEGNFYKTPEDAGYVVLAKKDILPESVFATGQIFYMVQE